MQIPSLAFLDIEATGLSPQSYPVEIGVALPSPTNDGWIIEVRSWLLRPIDEWVSRTAAWSTKAEELHGLPLSILLDAGEPPTAVAAELDALLPGRIVITDTGRHSWDAAWLSVLADATGNPMWPKHWRIAKETAGDLQAGLARQRGLTQDDVRSVLDAAPPHTHAAGDDAARQAWIWCALYAGRAPTLSRSSSYRRRHD